MYGSNKLEAVSCSEGVVRDVYLTTLTRVVTSCLLNQADDSGGLNRDRAVIIIVIISYPPDAIKVRG